HPRGAAVVELGYGGYRRGHHGHRPVPGADKRFSAKEVLTELKGAVNV
ncbi:MAG: hypothetical protein HFJ97_09840, partial [Eubacterium sp.]|nr:hypothetical protein [Eubacterium sp.]